MWVGVCDEKDKKSNSVDVIIDFLFWGSLSSKRYGARY